MLSIVGHGRSKAPDEGRPEVKEPEIRDPDVSSRLRIGIAAAWSRLEPGRKIFRVVSNRGSELQKFGSLL
jgi:hypothetical protein